jgi:hypothetical protein
MCGIGNSIEIIFSASTMEASYGYHFSDYINQHNNDKRVYTLPRKSNLGLGKFRNDKITVTT